MPKKKITHKLETLQKHLSKIAEAQVIDPDNSETWDADTLYNLVEECKAVIKLLKDQLIPGKEDEFGQPVVEDNLCSLVDQYHEKKQGHD